jgi:4-oxalocrotonate tautomerase
MLSGRSDETKQALVAKVTDALVDAAGATREHITIIINDVPHSNWAVSGETVPVRRAKREARKAGENSNG